MNSSIISVERTTIVLGDIKIDAYTAHEKDDKGNWINYLSNRGIAASIDILEQQVREKYMSKGLKAKLGSGFTVRESFYVMSSGGVTPVTLWSTKDAVKFWKYHEKKGNKKAEAILEALEDTTLNIIVNDAFDRSYKKGDAAKMVSDRILDSHAAWERLYDKAMCEKVFNWYGSRFYWLYAYHWMTPEERCKLDALNPVLQDGRKYRIHQYIEPTTRERLKTRVIELAILIRSSTSKQVFETMYMNAYGVGLQQELF